MADDRPRHARCTPVFDHNQGISLAAGSILAAEIGPRSCLEARRWLPGKKTVNKGVAVNRIAIVPNCLPLLQTEETSADGLAEGLIAALTQPGGIWLAWDGQVSSGPDDGRSIRQTDPFAVNSFMLSGKSMPASVSASRTGHFD